MVISDNHGAGAYRHGHQIVAWEKIMTKTIIGMGDQQEEITAYVDILHCTVLCESDSFSSIVGRLTNRE